MPYEIRKWGETRIVSMRDAAFREECRPPVRMLMALADRPPAAGRLMPAVYLHDRDAKTACEITLIDAVVRSVELTADDLPIMRVRMVGSENAWTMMLAVVVREEGTSGRADRFKPFLPETPDRLRDIWAIPAPWTFTWNIRPGGNWDAGREDGRFALFPEHGSIRMACGPDWRPDGDLPYPGAVVTLLPETVAAIRAWCAAPEAPFPNVPGVPERYQPKSYPNNAARLLRALDEIGRINRF